MREILFRGKRKFGDGWAYGSLILAGSYCCILESEEDVHPLDYPYLDDYLGTIDGEVTPVIPETVCQFTGLLDKNCKRIFEGDIVLVNGFNIPLFIEFTNLETDSEYAALSWNCRTPEHSRYLHRLENKPSKYEVIGNIHDNPELLEVK